MASRAPVEKTQDMTDNPMFIPLIAQPLVLTTGARITMITTAITAVATGVLGGVFFAFSTSVMKALGRQPAAAAMTTMQAVNVSMVNPLFLTVLGGSTLACLAILVSAPFVTAPHPGLRIAGALFFLVGAVGVTAVVNVPLNDALAAADPGSPPGVALWADYLTRWTAYNHLRTACSVAATVLLGLSTLRPGGAG